MRILIVSNLFPPWVMGGAEMVAHSLALWLTRRGHAVHVLTSAPSPEQAGLESAPEGFAVERRFFPNLYPVYQASEERWWRKLHWHVRDHFNSASEEITGQAIEQFQPDLAVLHNLQGLGYNLLREIGRRDLPCVQVMHDFGFVCLNMNRFRGGEPCRSQHWPCAVSERVKRGYLASIRRLAFWFPTAALRESFASHLPANAEVFTGAFPMLFTPPAQAGASPPDGPTRLLYVGQVTPPKGVTFLLGVLRALAAEGASFQFTVVGGGESLAALEEEYAGAAWVRFAGRVPPERVAEFMAESEALLIPSLWQENSPLVARQAVQMGLPILASAAGGLPEIVRAGENGLLLPPGDFARWREQLARWLAEPAQLTALRASAAAHCDSFAPDRLGAEALRLFERTLRSAPPTATVPVASLA